MTGAWLLIGALIPQIPPPSVVQKIGGNTWQVARLFVAHDLGVSWVTWLLITLLSLNFTGIALKLRPGRTSLLLPLAFLCGISGLALESLGTERGDIRLVEGKDIDQNGFRAIRHTSSGERPIQLPFSVSCEREEESSLPCTFHHPGNEKVQQLVPKSGEGTLRVAGLDLYFASSRTGKGSDWLVLENETFKTLLNNGDIVAFGDEKKSDGNPFKIGAVLSSQGPVLARMDEDLTLGLPSYWGITEKGAHVDGDEGAWRLRGPRQIVLHFRRASLPGLSLLLFLISSGLFLMVIGGYGAPAGKSPSPQVEEQHMEPEAS